MGICLVYVTNESKEKARSLVDQIVNEKLAACANVFPIESAYWWQGSIVRDHEVVSIFKTLPEHWEPLRDRISEIHPYEVPCIMKIEVEANESYRQWIVDSVLPI
ncbi:MAG: divalent-cation tolerance protein CutA [Saprospiraceae bacterium]|nr:divalent-cation tolerance protein CutA [Saprospiraceae bacterium]